MDASMSVWHGSAYSPHARCCTLTRYKRICPIFTSMDSMEMLWAISVEIRLDDCTEGMCRIFELYYNNEYFIKYSYVIVII